MCSLLWLCRALMSLPHHITTHSHITDFFTPHPQDHFLQDTLFEKIRALSGKNQAARLSARCNRLDSAPPHGEIVAVAGFHPAVCLLRDADLALCSG